MHGQVEFKDVSMRYSPDSPMVLQSLSFAIEGGMKVGICGPKGSGKSSIFKVLFRINDIFSDSSCGQGSILIDGVDIGTLGLHELRNILTVIPRDPVMFAGTVKDNLDYFHLHTEEELWYALSCAKLVRAVKKLPEGLAASVQEGGSVFSRGERQLACLSRALLRRPVVICLDEADCYDSHADTKIQNIISSALRSEFSKYTILTIAHNLNTIAHCDRILFIENGSVTEYDHPSTLLDRGPEGRFRQLIDELGDEAAADLEDRIRGVCPILDVAELEDAGVLSL
jgi:ABC-type multidrug transport system fused ATPase/permease subunit